MSDISDFDEDTYAPETIPFIRHVLIKVINKMDESIDTNTKAWHCIKTKLSYYMKLMVKMENDVLWKTIIEAATQDENVDIDSALETYKYELMKIGEDVVGDDE